VADNEESPLHGSDEGKTFILRQTSFSGEIPFEQNNSIVKNPRVWYSKAGADHRQLLPVYTTKRKRTRSARKKETLGGKHGTNGYDFVSPGDLLRHRQCHSGEQNQSLLYSQLYVLLYHAAAFHL
jgi:hypothetical protein